jgi:para-aminobenzoate synthetase component 1
VALDWPQGSCFTMTHFSQSSFLSGAPQPLVLTLEGQQPDPFDLYRRVASPSQPSFLLDSGKGFGAGARYSFIGCSPAAFLTGRNGRSSYRTREGGEITLADPFSHVGRMMADGFIHQTDGLPPFIGGAVGYMSYDLVRQFETLPSIAANDLSLPDLQFAFFEVIAAVEHQANCVHIIYCPSGERFLGEPREKLYREGLDRLAAFAAQMTGPFPETTASPSIRQVSFHPEQTQAAYMERVGRCQDYIAAGDIYQANLSHRFRMELGGNSHSRRDRFVAAQELYDRLRRINPSPFSGLLHFDDVTLVSCSPERLVRLQGRRADTRPIAGTRPRGRDEDDDRRLIKDLLSNEKERAEHLMLVDLERNDLGRVCQFGTVQVDEFMTIEQYSHVSHIVSNISGTLRQDATPFEVIKAMFPGGTITGVPKIRCMEIIEELEPVRRGPYTGSFGYLSWNGNLDLNIAIRTLVLCTTGGYLQVGAGIVADSDPAREYEETLHKAQAFFSSLQ